MSRKHESIRLQNLEQLIAEAGSAVRLARLAGTNSSYISQVRHQMPTRKGTPRGIGDDLAEKLERGMGKPVGWMDETYVGTENQAAIAGKAPFAQPGAVSRLHPLISWAEAGKWQETANGYVSSGGSELLPCPVKCSEKAYVLRIRGVSMEPRFHDGDLIFVDPDVTPEHGKLVVVLLQDTNEAVLRQLIIEGDSRYLKALNPDWPKPIIEYGPTATICGVVIFKGEVV
jgi:SOS-response transcriptional repressor LexA